MKKEKEIEEMLQWLKVQGQQLYPVPQRNDQVAEIIHVKLNTLQAMCKTRKQKFRYRVMIQEVQEKQGQPKCGSKKTQV